MRKLTGLSCYLFGTAALCCVQAGTARAEQEQAPQGDATSGEIVVTAQRRAQKLQDVGIAVTAAMGGELRSQNVLTSADIVRVVPSLKMTTYSSAAVIFNIRGVSQADYGDQQEPPVAVYQDDSYASSLMQAGFPIFDLARVEILRGPQGTLFGRNATGGAVQFISNQPTDTFDGYARLSYGSFDAFKAEGAISGPVTDTLLFRIAGQTSRGGNYYKTVVPGGHDLGGDNNYALRGILKWDGGNDVSASLILRYLKGTRERNAGMTTHSAACPNAQLQGEFLPASQSCAYWGTPPGTTATGYGNSAINPAQGGNPYRTAGTYPSYLDRQIFGAQLHVDAKLGNIDITSITDYQRATKFYSEDSDGTPDAAANLFVDARVSQISQELRASYASDRNFVTVGAMGIYVKGDYHEGFQQPVFDYLPDVTFQQKTASYAFFAQDEFKVTPKLKLIGGIRYWKDTRTLDYTAFEPGTGVFLQYNRSSLIYALNGVQQSLAGIRISPGDARKSFTGVTARAAIEYKPASNLLLYLSYNRGGKSGGFTVGSGTPFPSGVVDYLNNLGYRPESIDSFEAGVKATIVPGTTFNLSGYRYLYHDYQAFEQVGAIQTIANLDGSAYGMEAELVSKPVQGLTLKAATSLIHTRVRNILLPDGVTVVDHSLPQTPSFTGSLSGRYETALGKGNASVQADVQYNGRSCFTVLCAPVEKEAGYAVANIAIGYEIGKITIQGFVNNLTDKQYRVYATDLSLTSGTVYSVYARPRTVGASIEYRFR